MKSAWEKLALRIDALTLRERVIIFLSAALVLITVVNLLLLDPMSADQERIAKQMQEEQAQIAQIRAQIQQKINASANDPDAPARALLQALQQQREGLRNDVAAMQKGMVPPDRIPGLLESMLVNNRGLRLIGLKKLPVTNLTTASGNAGGQSAGEVAQDVSGVTGLFRHGVELTVQGGYLQMLDYLAALEQLPVRLLWGSVAFDVIAYPTATMRLTVYTLSLEKQWLHI